MGVHYNNGDFITYGKPSLLLDFANKKSLTDRISGNNLITFTRSSTGTYVGADGLIKTAATNEARFDHNPTTGESLGLLIEEARINYYTTSETLTNGRTGTSSGGNYTDFLSGGPQGGRFTRWARDTALSRTADWDWQIDYSNTGLSVGQTLNVSFYARCPNGTLASIALRNPDGQGSIFNLDTTWRRFDINLTYGGDYTTTPFFRFNRGHSPAYVNGATYDLAMIQIETSNYPTSYIPTTGSTVTRTTDIATITGTNFSSWFNASAGTFFTNYISTNPVNERILNFGSGPVATIISNEGVMGSGLYFSSVGNISGSASDGVKVVSATSVSESAGTFDGNSVTSTGACSYYSTATSLHLVAGAAAVRQNRIKQIKYYPIRLTNTQLQNITR
jgi:hypothetical protein